MIYLLLMLIMLFGLPILTLYLVSKYKDITNFKINKPYKYLTIVTCLSFIIIRYSALIDIFEKWGDGVYQVKINIVPILLTIVAVNIVSVLLLYLNNKFKLIKFNFEGNIKRKTWVITSIIFILGFVIFVTIDYIINTFGDVSLQQLLFNLLAPIDGASEDQINRAIFNPLLNGIVISILFISIFNISYNVVIDKFSFTTKLINKVCRIFAIVLLVFSLLAFNKQFRVDLFIKTNFEKSNFIEDNYVSPDDVTISLNGEKRNMIHIYLESMESSFADVDNGGMFDTNYIPNLTNLAQDNVSFTEKDDEKQLGGSICLDGTNFTSGGLTATELGIPLKISTTHSNRLAYGLDGVFMEGALGLGNILDKAGYQNVFWIGSEAQFGGREALMRDHGYDEIVDYNVLKSLGEIDQNYKVNWGVEDEKIFDSAKGKLTQMANSGEPFNLTMLTTDTHAPDGWYNPDKPALTNNPYLDAVTYNDQVVYDFVSWCQQQPWYENTTIVLTGDHTSMNSYSFGHATDKELETGFVTRHDIDGVPKDRRVYNAFINVPNQDNVKKTSREFFTMDYMPTILGSLGFNIEGDRLGLGTNLFSETKTLAEEYGVKHVENELLKVSTFYNDEFLKPTTPRKYNGSKLIIDGQPSE